MPRFAAWPQTSGTGFTDSSCKENICRDWGNRTMDMDGKMRYNLLWFNCAGSGQSDGCPGKFAWYGKERVHNGNLLSTHKNGEGKCAIFFSM